MEDLIPEVDEDETHGALVQDVADSPRPRGRRQVSDATLQRIQEFVNTPSRRQAAPAQAEKKPKPLGFMGTIKEGGRGTLRALGAAADTYQGDAEEVVSAAQAQSIAPKDPDLERFYAHIDEQKQRLGDNPSLWEGIKAVGGAAIDNPRGFGLMVAEQLPNSGVALGAGAAGALAGSLAGPGGAIVGGLAGLATANIGLETGSKALDAAQDQEFTPEEQSRVRREGLVKGGVITGVDAATLGVTKFITNASRRAVERATIKTLTDNGVDVTSAAARRAAMETPEIAEKVKSAQTLAKEGATTLGKRLAQTSGAVALETIGEGAGEYLGELAATGKANAVDAVIEGFAGLGTSIGEIAATGALNRKGLQRLLDTPEEAEKTAADQTKETGVEHEAIQHPTEPDKFVAVPKVRSVGGIELERDAEGNLKPVAPEPSMPAPPQEAAPAKVEVPTIAGKPAGDMSNNALIYTVERGSARAQKIATDELAKREKEGVDSTIANAPEKPADTVTRIITTGKERAQEDGKKAAASIITPAVVKPATAPRVAPGPVPEAKKVIAPVATPKAESKVEPIAPIAKPKEPQASNPPVSPKAESASQSDSKRFDHGELNIKGRTNNIDRELDKYKKEQAILAKTKTKATAQQTKEHKALAKSLLSQFGNEIIEKHKDKFGEKELRKTLDQWSKWEPHKLISFVDKFIQEKVAVPTSKAQTAKAETPATEAVTLRNHITDLIKRRAAANQSGKARSVNSAIDRAKEVMNGQRTDTAAESKWFRAHAAVIRKVDPETADILSRISEAIKAQVAPIKAKADNASNEKAEKAKPVIPVRGDSRPVFQPRGGRIIANGIAETIQKNGVAALIGQKITSPERLAELAQIYRNPQYETFRIFFTKGNQIVHASGVTSRLPGSAPLFPKDMDTQQGVGWIKSMMRSSGADGYWLLHNHPSGNPTPSKADVNVTEYLERAIPGMKGHVVINSNKYAQIMPARGRVKSQVISRHFAEETLIKASKPHEYIGKQISSPEEIAITGKSFQKEGWVTLIGLSGVSGVRSIAEIPLKTFTTSGLARAAIRRFARQTGAGSVFAYGSAKDLKAGKAAELMRDGFLRDAVDETGKGTRAKNAGKSFGIAIGDGGREVQQQQAPFNTSTIRTRIDKITDSLIFNFQDRFKPLKDIQKRAGPVPEDADASLAEERYSGMVRARMDTFEQQMRDPLLKAIHDSGVPFEEVEKYLHALHAPSRNAAMREINPTEAELKTQTEALEKQRDSLANDKDVKEYLKERRDLRQAEADIEDGIADETLATMIKSELARLRKVPSVKTYTEALDKLRALRSVKPFQGDNTALSGMSNAEAKAILSKTDANGTRKALDKISDLVDTITSRTRQIFVESGLEKADTIDAWNKKYEHYIPLHRDEVTGNTMPKVGQGFNIRGKESKRATGSTKEVTNILAHVVAQHEAAIVRSEKSKVDRALFQFATTHPDPSLWALDVAPMLKTVDPTSGLVVERVDPTYKNRDEVLTLKIDGEEHTITFNDQNQEAMRLVASMKNISSQQLGEVTQMVGKFTRFLATMNTTANPVFVARNFLRDLQTAFVNLSDTEIAAKKKEVFQNIPAAIKGMWNLSRGKGNSQWAKYAQEFKSAGGQTGWMEHYKDIGARAESLKQELAAMKPGKANLARRNARAWWQMVEDANNAVENGARLAAYVAARKSGISEGKAASMAKNLTVNFNARGAKGVELNMWYMFMNASIQGTARLIKAMSNKQVRKIVAGVVLSGFLMDIMARSMAGDDDEDGENDYDQLPEHTKAMNFVFMIDNQPVTIPMPYGYNFFASAGRKISEMMFRENYSPVRSAVDLTSVFLGAFSPVGQAGSGLQYIAPTVADPLIQWAENKNFAGNPLRKPQNSFGVPKPEFQMGFKSTSAPAKWLAETLNEETGGNEVRPGYVNVNPAFFDFAVSSILGGAGRTYLQAVSGPVKILGDGDLQAREIPFANIFVGARPEHQTERKYFEAVDDVELANKELDTFRKKGDTEMVRQIRDDHGEVIRLEEAAKAAKGKLTHLSKQDLALDKTNPPNKAELRKKIEERKREVMARFNKRYREATTAE